MLIYSQFPIGGRARNPLYNNGGPGEAPGPTVTVRMGEDNQTQQDGLAWKYFYALFPLVVYLYTLAD
jgi:hypothetical protein